MDFVRDKPGEPLPEETFTHSTHTYRGHQSSLNCFIHLLWSIASSLFNPCTWQSFSTICLQVFFGLTLGLAPSTSYSIHFFTQSFSSFRNTSPYRHQKGKLFSILMKQEMTGWQWHHLDHMQITCNSLQITMTLPHNSVFTGWMPFLSPNSVKALKADTETYHSKIIFTKLFTTTEIKVEHMTELTELRFMTHMTCCFGDALPDQSLG